MIPDSFGVAGCSAGSRSPVAGRSEPGEPAAAIDQTDIEVAEAHDMVAGFEFGDADELAGQGLADEDEARRST